jgi:uncharacterized RDD family membrane protein YckC
MDCKAPLAPQVADLAHKIIDLNQARSSFPSSKSLAAPAGESNIPAWKSELNSRLEQIFEKKNQAAANKDATSVGENFKEKEFVRPQRENPASSPEVSAPAPSPLVEQTLEKISRIQSSPPVPESPPVNATVDEKKAGSPTLQPEIPAPDRNPLVERTLEKIKRVQPSPPAPESPPSEGKKAAASSPAPTPRRPRKPAVDSGRVERIEINLNQPMLPFEGGETIASGSPIGQVARGLMAAPISPRLTAGIVDLFFIASCFLIFLLMVLLFVPDFSLFSRFSLGGLAAAILLIGTGYLFLFTSFVGRSLGMEHQRLRVISFAGNTPSAHEVLLRVFGYVISGGCFGLGFLWAVFDPEKLTWHDRISGTLIISNRPRV